MKITIAIPNFNGQNLLRDNLPTILKAGADEILVIDDGSTDKSVDVMRSEFPEVKILINENNLGFIPSVNKLFQEAQGEVVVLLNSDVLVEKDFLENLTHHFKDKKTFAVNCHEIGGGPARAFWKTGYFEFGQENEKNEVQKSAWASGGSASSSPRTISSGSTTTPNTSFSRARRPRRWAHPGAPKTCPCRAAWTPLAPMRRWPWSAAAVRPPTGLPRPHPGSSHEHRF